MSSELMIYYKNDRFNPLIMKRQFTELDLVSYTGGALGLFLGFSVVSFIEIIYYFTIRLFFEKLRLRRVEVLGHRGISESNLFKQYLTSSSIHGMNQMTHKRRHVFERVIWSLVVSIALVYSAIVIYQMYQHYENAPIVASFEDKAVNSDDVS
jgi:Amiloride-sensitive sodium channel